MADFNLGEGLRKLVLAGVGAVAVTIEKSTEIIDDLVAKGEITVEQGKALNEELKRKAKERAEAVKNNEAAAAAEHVDPQVVVQGSAARASAHNDALQDV